MDLVQVGSIYLQRVPGQLSSRQGGRCEWEVALHVQGDTRSPQWPEREMGKAPSNWKYILGVPKGIGQPCSVLLRTVLSLRLPEGQDLVELHVGNLEQGSQYPQGSKWIPYT